jgi:hypothetical protein
LSITITTQSQILLHIGIGQRAAQLCWQTNYILTKVKRFKSKNAKSSSSTSRKNKHTTIKVANKLFGRGEGVEGDAIDGFGDAQCGGEGDARRRIGEAALQAGRRATQRMSAAPAARAYASPLCLCSLPAHFAVQILRRFDVSLPRHYCRSSATHPHTTQARLTCIEIASQRSVWFEIPWQCSVDPQRRVMSIQRQQH